MRTISQRLNDLLSEGYFQFFLELYFSSFGPPMNHIASKYRIQHSGEQKKRERKKKEKRSVVFEKIFQRNRVILTETIFLLFAFFILFIICHFMLLFLTFDLSRCARASARAARARSYSHVLPWLGQELVTQIENELYILFLS